MSETFPEDWGAPAPADPAAVPAEAPPAPRVFTPEELAAAREQLQAQGTDLGPAKGADVAESGAALGMQALAAGAEATEVDTSAMLAQIKALAAKVAALEQEKRLSQAPDVVKYAQALHDHLAVKASQHPAVQGDPDHTYGQAPSEAGTGGRGVLGATGRLVTAAEGAAETGHPGTMAADVAKVETWVSRHARRFPQIDYAYVLELAGETAGAIAKLAA